MSGFPIVLAAGPGTNLPICQVYANNSYYGNCQSLVSQLPWFYVPLLYGLIGAVALLFAFLVFTKWHQRPYGRALEGWTGMIGVGRFPRGGGILGKLSHFSEKILLFEPIGRRKERANKVLISAVPESVIQLDQKDGGVSFAFIDMNTRYTSGPPELVSWADRALGDLSKTHDWETFLFKWKLEELKRIQYKQRYPMITEETPPEQVLLFALADGRTYQKALKDLTQQERNWYQQASVAESTRLEEVDLLEVKLEALIKKEKFYRVGEQKVEFQIGERADMATSLTRELENSATPVSQTMIGGRMVDARRIASIVLGMPDARYINALKADMEERIRRSQKTNLKDIMPWVIAVGAIIGFMVIGVVILKSVLHF